MLSTDTAHTVEGEELVTALEELLGVTSQHGAPALPVFATEDPHKAKLLAHAERILRSLHNRLQATGLGDTCSVGPFDAELYPLVEVSKMEGAVAVGFDPDACVGAPCLYGLDSRWAIIGALLEVGLSFPTKTVLAEQRSLVIRLLLRCRGLRNRPPVFGCLQISWADVWTAVYQPRTDPVGTLASRLQGSTGQTFWVKTPANASVPPLEYFTRDLPGLMEHLSGHVTARTLSTVRSNAV